MNARLKSADLNAVVASVPSNATAARVIGKGIHYERAMKPSPNAVRASPDPLPMMPMPRWWAEASRKTYAELVGNQFGRWRVLGLSALGPGSGGARWVVKCSCGRYEHRSHKAIRRAPETGDCCEECRNLQYIKRKYKELGSKPLQEFSK